MKTMFNRQCKLVMASLIVFSSLNGFAHDQSSQQQLSSQCAVAVEAKAAIGLNYADLLTKSCSKAEIKMMASGTTALKQQIASIQGQLAATKTEKLSGFTTFVANNDLGTKLVVSGVIAATTGPFVIMSAYTGSDESLDYNTPREQAKLARGERQMKIGNQIFWVGPVLIALGVAVNLMASEELKTYAVKKQDEQNLKNYLADLQARVQTIQTLNTRLSVD